MLDISKIKEVYKKSKKLILEMITYNNKNFEFNSKNSTFLEINPFGYVSSPRKIKDGLTFFGFADKNNLDKISEEELDVIISPIDLNNIDNKYYGKHFQIKFNPNDLNYYIKDLGHGFGTFIKITDFVEIKNNFLLNIGDNYIVFSIGNDNEFDTNENYINNSEFTLNVKIFSGNIKKNVLYFSPNDSPFTIGRSIDNAICIEDGMLSRIHCSIIFKNDKWLIKDGTLCNNETEGKKSTNGSWVYAFDDTLIEDKMTFKAAHNLFFCRFEDINKNE